MPPKLQDDDLVMSLVEMALRKPSSQRLQYVTEACGKDTELFTRVWDYVRWEQQMKGFLSEPLYAPLEVEHPFEPGELLEGRFRIIREVAQGGMGIVYEAIDEKLDRRIALKCAKAGFRKRLPPEVRHASDISHPNVCKIFEIHTASTNAGEVEFLTMEFLDGETLAERVHRGPLTAVEARTIGLQICAGVAEAHRKQVIHGDLKSSNVIVAKESDGGMRAVVTDFGLARQPAAASRNLQSGPLAGTPDYMAPELWKGEKPSVASDIYALGVILRELASGKTAPAGWNGVVHRCLDPDPARRFYSVDEISHALTPHTRRWFIAIAAAALLATASGILTYGVATGPSEHVRVAVLPFESGSDARVLAARLSDATSEELRHLKGSSQTDISVIREKRGATHVLYAVVQKEAAGLVIQASLRDARSLANTNEWKATYGLNELRYAPVALAGMITEEFHLPPAREFSTVNAAARQDYDSGYSI